MNHKRQAIQNLRDAIKACQDLGMYVNAYSHNSDADENIDDMIDRESSNGTNRVVMIHPITILDTEDASSVIMISWKKSDLEMELNRN